MLSSAASHRLSQSDERSHAALQEASFARMAGQHAKAALAVQDALESARNRERQTARYARVPGSFVTFACFQHEIRSG